ncbi:MAG TPA: hypothetical protein VFX68_02180 [Sulfuricurvum sp.]|nr:hypothetical protein [Sulfuricurvum sp.]
MNIVPLTEENLQVYLNLAQCYEGEFSAITGKKPNQQGLFELDTQLDDSTIGLLLIIEDTPCAFAAIAIKEDKSYEICEFYVVPSFRKNSVGMKFARMIWSIYPGDWEIKQIAGAEYASAFWRKAIHTIYQEDRYEDSYWGTVTRQRFTIN